MNGRWGHVISFHANDIIFYWRMSAIAWKISGKLHCRSSKNSCRLKYCLDIVVAHLVLIVNVALKTDYTGLICPSTADCHVNATKKVQEKLLRYLYYKRNIVYPSYPLLVSHTEILVMFKVALARRKTIPFSYVHIACI